MWALVSPPGGPAMMIWPLGSTVRGWQLEQSRRVIEGRCGENAGGSPWQDSPQVRPPVVVQIGARSIVAVVSAASVAPPPWQ